MPRLTPKIQSQNRPVPLMHSRRRSRPTDSRLLGDDGRGAGNVRWSVRDGGVGTASRFKVVYKPRALSIVFLLMIVAGLLGPLAGHAQTPHVLVMDVDGIINPVKQRFIARALEESGPAQAELLVIELDTPGGLLDSTRKIVELLLDSPIPVAVYVTPAGARAGSAGTFITAAANFAVMTPGTNIGAASPVSSTGEDLENTMASKVENDAAALIRSIAQERGRNEDKLEETVRQAASFTASEAVDFKVVDFIAEDLDHLLDQLHGREVETATGARRLNVQGVEQRPFEKNVLEIFLEIISNPNVSFILLTLGGLGLVIELFSPGLIGPGVVGAICLLLAFLALGNLPVNWIGVIFLALAIGLVVLEIQVSGFGIFGIGAIVSFIVSGILLFNEFGAVSPTMPEVSVSWWLIGGMAATLALALLFVVITIRQSRQAVPQASGPGLVGETGVVVGELAPRGLVRVGEETWTAISEDGTVVNTGETVIVAEVDGLILTVFRVRDTEI